LAQEADMHLPALKGRMPQDGLLERDGRGGADDNILGQRAPHPGHRLGAILPPDNQLAQQ
jgi:hypothetical protein